MDIKEKEVKAVSGYPVLSIIIASAFIIIALFIYCIAFSISSTAVIVSSVLFVLFALILPVISMGFRILKPNQAYVFTLFGKYHGTLKREGFYFVNPFAVASNGSGERKAVSLRVQSLVNAVQKVNDRMGNPIMVGAVVIWKVEDPTKAVFVVDNYNQFLSNQADSIIRNVARLYPYDSLSDSDENEELTLRGSSEEIAERMQKELEESVMEAGLKIMEVRINQLSYAEEIAQAMLQRQQAAAIIAARRKIVEGAVSMVDMALSELKKGQVVELDEEHKAQMVSNLLVVLCGSKDAQPIVNSGAL